MTKLTQAEKERYTRHLIIPEFTEEHQLKLKNARVLIVGVGGLGSPISTYLNAAGVGCIGLIDDDVVSDSNLQRQVLYTQREIGTPKVECAKNRLQLQNPNTSIITYPQRLTPENAEEIISNYDIVMDGSDNFEVRYIIDEVCAKKGIPYVYGSIEEFKGQLSVFNYQGGMAYRDLFPENNASEEERTRAIGVLGALPGIIGSMQANEAIKLIAGLGEPLSGKLMLFDSLTTSFNVFSFGA